MSSLTLKSDIWTWLFLQGSQTTGWFVTECAKLREPMRARFQVHQPEILTALNEMQTNGDIEFSQGRWDIVSD